MPLTFENLGLRPISIIHYKFELCTKLQSLDIVLKLISTNAEIEQILTIKPGEIVNLTVTAFEAHQGLNSMTETRKKVEVINNNLAQLYAKPILLKLSTESEISANILLIK